MASLREIKVRKLVLLTEVFVFQLIGRGNNEGNARRSQQRGIHEFIIKKKNMAINLKVIRQ
jgi:hypothetical protein